MRLSSNKLRGLGLAALLVGVVASAQAQTYTAIDLGAGYGLDINNSGQVVGASGIGHAFLYSGGTMIDLGTLGGALSKAIGINDSGQVVGWAQTASGASHAFLYSGGNITDLGTFGGVSSMLCKINATGQAVGTLLTPAGYTQGFLYSGGTVIDLSLYTADVPCENIGPVQNINSSGQVVGFLAPSSRAFNHASLYSGGIVIDLGTFGGLNSDASGINASGQVVGWAQTPSGAFDAFLYSGGTMTDLGRLGGIDSSAWGINASGHVVGVVYTSNSDYYAFLFDGVTMKDLNSLVTLPPGVYLGGAVAINDLGQIAANGSDDHAYLLTPCPAPVTLDASGPYMFATFTPPPILGNPNPSLLDYASYCGFISFNWQQMVTTLPSGGGGVQPNNPGPLIASGNVVYLDTIVSSTDGHCISNWNGCSLIAPPAFTDPPLGGYTNLGDNPYPFYYPLGNFFAGTGTGTHTLYCTMPHGQCPPFQYQVSPDGYTFSFADNPATPFLPGDPPSPNPTSGHFVAFQTSLVGVDAQENAHPLSSWTWNSTYNGKAGGAAQTASVYPTDPGSGTGGVTITSINGVALPSLAAPVLTSPANGATGVTTTPTLTWSATSGATSYDVYFGTSSTPPMVTNVAATSYAPATLSAGTTYYWHIAAVYNNVLIDSGSPWSFTTLSPAPLPAISNLSPASATAGGAGFTLTVNGSGFFSGSVVQWNGSSRTTTYVSATQLRASITASDISSAGTAQVAVFNPAPGGGTSSAFSFAINGSPPTTMIVTNPAGLSIVVDGNLLTGPWSFQWTVGSQHSIGLTSPQGTGGTRHIFANWSDGGNQTHTIAAPSSATTYTANFTTQYLLAMQASPTAGGSITASPSSTDGYYNSGTAVQLTPVAANCEYEFTNWSSDLTGTTNPASLNMNAPHTVTAGFYEYRTFSDNGFFVCQQYLDLLGRAPDTSGYNYWVGLLNSVQATRGQVADAYFVSPEFQGDGFFIISAYVAVLGRNPDYAGWLYWLNNLWAGTTQQQVIDSFVQSAEFQQTYGTLNNTQFVTLVYQNVLGRAPDPTGLSYWVGLLNSGAATQAQCMYSFATSAEFQNSIQNQGLATLLYMGFLRRSPDPTGVTYWTGQLNYGIPPATVLTGFITSAEYIARF